jgi:uncharacterized membrane protein
MTGNVRSTATIAGHPIHPMFVPFPIAFWLAALVCDAAFAFGADEGWAIAAFWLVGAGIAFALLAAVFGFADFFGEPRIRELRHAWEHMLGNLVAVTIAAVSFLLRLTNGAADAVLPWGLLASCMVAAVLVFTGWRGADLVYRHATGVRNERIPSHNKRSTNP